MNRMHPSGKQGHTNKENKLFGQQLLAPSQASIASTQPPISGYEAQNFDGIYGDNNRSVSSTRNLEVEVATSDNLKSRRKKKTFTNTRRFLNKHLFVRERVDASSEPKVPINNDTLLGGEVTMSLFSANIMGNDYQIARCDTFGDVKRLVDKISDDNPSLSYAFIIQTVVTTLSPQGAIHYDMEKPLRRYLKQRASHCLDN